MGTAESLDRLQAMLAEPYDRCRARGLSLPDEMIRGRPLVLHGSGGFGRELLHALRDAGRGPVAFSDNNRALWGSSIDGLPVFAPDEAVKRYGETCAFAVSIWSPGAGFAAIRSQLQNLGAQIVVPGTLLLWQYRESLLPHFMFAPPEFVIEHADEIMTAASAIGSAESLEYYTGQIAWRLTMDYDQLLPPVSGPQYFPDGVIVPRGDWTFVDCGAFDGDTIQSFLDATGGEFDSIYAFEPEPSTFERLESYRASLPPDVAARIHTMNAALSDSIGMLRFDGRGAEDSRATETGAVEVACLKLDDVVAEASYIKMDIEGAEAAAMKGGARLIAEHRPALAISLYHKPEDIFVLPNLARSLNAGYRLECRPHQADGVDFVLYALQD